MNIKTDVSSWYWQGFHQRGWLSHRYRYRALKHIPMPASGNEKAWLDCRLRQATACLFQTSCANTMTLMNIYLTDVANADLADEAWWHKHAPAGSVSPLGTVAAAKAFIEVRAAHKCKGYNRGIRLPFLMATARELLSLTLIHLFGLVIPIAYPIACFVNDSELSWLKLFALAIVSFIASDYAEWAYQRQL
jgi:hypothetical protein